MIRLGKFYVQDVLHRKISTTHLYNNRKRINLGKLSKLKQKAEARLNILDEVKNKKAENHVKTTVSDSQHSKVDKVKLAELKTKQTLVQNSVSLKPYNTNWPLNQVTAQPKTHVWRIIEKSNTDEDYAYETLLQKPASHFKKNGVTSRKLISFCIHNSSSISISDQTLESLIKQLEPDCKQLSKNMNVAWQDSISPVTWHGYSAKKDEYVSSFRQGVILPDLLERNNQLYFFLIQPPHFIAPDSYRRGENVCYKKMFVLQ